MAAKKPIPPKIVWDLKTPCLAVTRAVGRDKLVELQRTNSWADAAICIGTWGAFVGLWWVLATTRNPWVWLPCAALQATVIMCGFFVLRHDLFFHRRVGGARFSYIIGVLTSQVMLQPYTEHTLHADHHVHVGWDLSEEFFFDLDKRWKRWLCLTAPGIILMLTRALRPKNAPQPNKGWLPPPMYIRRLRRERRLLIFSVIVLAATGYWWHHGILFGYVLPVLLFGPFVIMARIVFQHGETDPANPFHVTVLYRTGPLSRVLFFWSLGDGHLAHHLFPAIPLYRLGKAADMFLPVLREHGVPERSLYQVLKGFFVDGYEIRTRWPLPGSAVAPVVSPPVESQPESQPEVPVAALVAPAAPQPSRPPPP